MDDIIREAAKYRLDKSIKGGLAGVQSGSMSIESPSQGEYRWVVDCRCATPSIDRLDLAESPRRSAVRDIRH